MSLFLFLIILNKTNEIFTNNSRFIFSIKYIAEVNDKLSTYEKEAYMVY
ncbi:hypothetical protein LACR103602_05245 [Lactobacillus crispatus]